MNFLSKNPTLGHLQVSLLFMPLRLRRDSLRSTEQESSVRNEIEKSASQRKDNHCILGPFLIVESHCLHVFNSVMLFVYLLFVNPPIKTLRFLMIWIAVMVREFNCNSYHSMSNKFISYPETFPETYLLVYIKYLKIIVTYTIIIQIIILDFGPTAHVLLNLSLQFHRLPWPPSTKLVAMLP